VEVAIAWLIFVLIVFLSVSYKISDARVHKLFFKTLEQAEAENSLIVFG
jgi:hypothetical protein